MVDGGARAGLRAWLEGLAEWLLPPACLLCGGGGGALCPGCLGVLPRLGPACPRCALPLPGSAEGPCGACLRRPPLFEALIAPFAYGPPLDRLLQALKYRGRLELARPLARAVAPTWLAAGPPDLIVPVPLHARRLRARGFNQAMELAREAAARSGAPLDPWLLRRVRDTPPQAGLEARARWANLRGAFALAGPPPQGALVAVVDDVVTTGATVAELARLLLRAGAGKVRVWAVARALPPGAAPW